MNSSGVQNLALTILFFSLLKTDFLEDEFNTHVNVKTEPEKTDHLPFLQKMEDMSVEELEKMVLERYKPGSSLITYAEDACETKQSFEPNTVTPSVEKVIPYSEDPIIWKVKCMVMCLILFQCSTFFAFNFLLFFILYNVS